MRTKRRNQRRIDGGREALPSCVADVIWNRVDREARVYNVSRSFVIAVALADAFGIPLESADRYNQPYKQSKADIRRVK